MVIYKEWFDFEKEIIESKSFFYLYGAGKIYKKIINVIKGQVEAVFDIKAEELHLNDGVKVVHPSQITSMKREKFYILSCLDPFSHYRDRTYGLKDMFEQVKADIYIYMLPNESISETGILNWGGQELLIDNVLCIVNSGCYRNFMKAAYKNINDYDELYMKRLYEEPYGFQIIDSKRIGLCDYDNGLITHQQGRKKTVRLERNSYDRRVWLFGDSRITGQLNENGTTIASYLQKKFDVSGVSYEVINCGIPGRDIERMVYQVETEDIRSGDYVILGAGFYEYEGDYLLNSLVWAEFINKAKNISEKKGAGLFCYINLPIILEMQELSDLEEEMLRLFHTTEFLDYTIEKIEYCKSIIRNVCIKEGTYFIDYSEVFKYRKEYGHVFINMHHYGPAGNQLIADGMWKWIKGQEEIAGFKREAIISCVKEKEKLFLDKIALMQESDEEIQKYLLNICSKVSAKNLENKSKGAIVMNANPFTKGHMHLVNQALDDVDFLFVFVVSEDSSYFSFADRFRMVYENLLENDRCLVVPSGRYCISRSTFPEYFKKEDLQGVHIDTKKDLELFVKKICPKLGITKRYVGEEPDDKITEQYNRDMKIVLPESGIEVVEIPRIKKDENTVISASRVREYWKIGDYNELEKYVPQKTLQILKEIEGNYVKENYGCDRNKAGSN